MGSLNRSSLKIHVRHLQSLAGAAARSSASSAGANEFLAKWISAVAIFPCEGAREAESERALAAAFEKGGWERVRRLCRQGDLPDAQCWLASDWALAYA
jgi:hypothetical protein